MTGIFIIAEQTILAHNNSSDAASRNRQAQTAAASSSSSSSPEQEPANDQARNNLRSNSNKMNHQQPVVDLIVFMISIPTLVIFALMLESNMREDWTENASSRWTVFGLGVGLLLVSLLICGYITHRMGVCLWANPLDDENYPSGMTGVNSETNLQHLAENMPPSYDVVMGYDIPPPPYHCVVNIDCKDKEDPVPPYPSHTSLNYI